MDTPAAKTDTAATLGKARMLHTMIRVHDLDKSIKFYTELLGELRATVESECDYVGERFSEEARRMHYGEAEKRGIYGEASDEQAKELVDEGIEVKKIPWLPRRDA